MDKFGTSKIDEFMEYYKFLRSSTQNVAIKSNLDEIKKTIYERNDRTLHGSSAYMPYFGILFAHNSIPFAQKERNVF